MNRQQWVAGGKTVSLAGEQVWYRIDGSGPTLLFAHGFPTSSHDYAPIIETLGTHHRCVSFDFLGFGASSKPRRIYHYPLQHEVLAKVVETVGISNAVLVAHDYAVTLGQDFLAGTPRAPFALDGIVFLNGGLDPAQHRPRPLQRLLATRAGAVLGPLLLNRKAVLRTLREVFVEKDALPEDDAWSSIASGGGRWVMPRLLHYIAERRGRRAALVAALKQATVPTAFAWGMHDPVSGSHVLEAIRPLVKGAPMLELQGIGHYPQLEAPELVASFIEQTVSSWFGGRKF